MAFLLAVGAVGAAVGAAAGWDVAYLYNKYGGGIHPIGRWSNWGGYGGYAGQFYGSYSQLYFYPPYFYYPQYSYSCWRPYYPMFGY